MTKLEKLNALNELLKAVYEQGWRIGASWNNDKFNELFDINGYLKDDLKIEKDLRAKIDKLLIILGFEINDLIVYTKEDLSMHENDWEYIAPVLELKEKE